MVDWRCDSIGPSATLAREHSEIAAPTTARTCIPSNEVDSDKNRESENDNRQIFHHRHALYISVKKATIRPE